jgi:hypothetical protein
MMAQRKKRATLGKRKSTARSQGGKTRKPTRGKAAKPPNRSQENVWLRPCPNALERRSVPGKEHGTTRPTSATDAPVAPHDTAERRQVSVISPTWWVQRPCRRAWTLKTSARLFRPTKDASPRPWVASEASWRSTWGTGCGVFRVSAGP